MKKHGMEIYFWAELLIDINSISDVQEDDISFEKLRGWIKEKTLMENMSEKYNHGFQFLRIKKLGYIDDFYDSLSEVMDGNYFVQYSGLHLFMAFCIEIISQKSKKHLG